MILPPRPPADDQRLAEGPAEEETRLEIHVQLQIPFRLAHLVQRLPPQDAGHMGECPQVPQGFGCLLHQAVESAYVADVVTLRPVPGGIPQPGNRPMFTALPLNVDREHPRPSLRQRLPQSPCRSPGRRR